MVNWIRIRISHIQLTSGPFVISCKFKYLNIVPRIVDALEHAVLNQAEKERYERRLWRVKSEEDQRTPKC